TLYALSLDVLVVHSKAQSKMLWYFFFQAEDGIRYRNVTGVQTCALPICATLEEPHVQGSLERPDPGADRRLGEAERLRRAAEAAEGADRKERLDLRDLHDWARGVSLTDKYILSRL